MTLFRTFAHNKINSSRGVFQSASYKKNQLGRTNAKEVMDVFPIFRRWNRANHGDPVFPPITLLIYLCAVDRKRVVGKSRIGSTWQTGWPPCRHTSGQRCLQTNRTGCPLPPTCRQGRQSWWWRTFSCTAPWTTCTDGRCCQKRPS